MRKTKKCCEAEGINVQMFVDNKKNKSFIGRRVVSPNNLERECGQDVSGNLIKHPCFNQLRGTDGYRGAG